MDAVDTAMLTMKIRNLFIFVFFVVLLFTVFLPDKDCRNLPRNWRNPECDPALERQE
jgi:hypothetical protein